MSGNRQHHSQPIEKFLSIMAAKKPETKIPDLHGKNKQPVASSESVADKNAEAGKTPLVYAISAFTLALVAVIIYAAKREGPQTDNVLERTSAATVSAGGENGEGDGKKETDIYGLLGTSDREEIFSYRVAADENGLKYEVINGPLDFEGEDAEIMAKIIAEQLGLKPGEAINVYKRNDETAVVIELCGTGEINEELKAKLRGYAENEIGGENSVVTEQQAQTSRGSAFAYYKQN